MRMYDLIMKKRNGKPLEKEEIDWMISEYTAGRIPDYQMSAFLMAVYFQGMSKEETLNLTMAMAHSGAPQVIVATTSHSVPGARFFGLAVRIGQCLGRRKLSDNIGRSELLANFTIGTIGNRSHRSECRRLFYGYISNLELCNQSVFSPLLGQWDGKAAARPCKKGCPVVYLFRL